MSLFLDQFKYTFLLNKKRIHFSMNYYPTKEKQLWKFDLVFNGTASVILLDHPCITNEEISFPAAATAMPDLPLPATGAQRTGNMDSIVNSSCPRAAVAIPIRPAVLEIYRLRE
jgi:hypothetical protein